LQEVEDDDEDDAVDDEDVAAEDEELLGAAADLLPALAASMGPDAYAAVFLSLHAEPLLARLRPQQPAALRAIAAGAAAEVAEALGGRIAAVVEPLMTLMLRELQTEVGVVEVQEAVPASWGKMYAGLKGGVASMHKHAGKNSVGIVLQERLLSHPSWGRACFIIRSMY
jgi:hypothetical protein